MAIKLAKSEFTTIPEGEHTFKIVEAEYKADFGKMIITMATKTGLKHVERYSLIKTNGETNEGALKAFSFMAKTALNDFALDEIDENDLVGCYLKGVVTHSKTPSTKNPDKMMTFTNLSDIEPALGFEDAGNEDAEGYDPLDDI